MKSISFDQIKTMLKSMSYSIFTRLRIVEKDIEGIRGKLPTTTEIIFTKGEDGNYTCNIPHTELWEMDADAIGRNARIIDGDKIYGVRGASKNTENLYGNVIQVYADLNVGSYDIPGTPPRTLILTYCIPEIVGTQMIYSEETSGLSNFPRSNIQSRVNIPVLYNGIWRNRYAEFMEENSLTGNMELSTMSPTVKGGAKVGEGLKMDGDALTVDEGEWELVEKTTIAERTSLFTRTQEPDGEAYNFKALSIKITFQKDASDLGSGQFRCYNKSVMLCDTWMSNKSSAQTSVNIFFAECWIDKGYWRSVYTDLSTSYGGTLNHFYKDTYMALSEKAYPIIDDMQISAKLPAGTTIEIWGVRA